MAKILKIENDTVMIGNNDGGIRELLLTNCNFTPNVGDEVEIYETDKDVIVVKKENTSNKGINVNVSNNANNTPPVYVTCKKSVNKIVYCLLALFLGGIGIHKFYGGKIGTGILFFLFAWTFIPCIVALIEFIAALFITADSNGNILV